MISAKVICDSLSEQGIRLTTFEIEVPRIVWAEFMTHRQLSRNAASSRAIPAAKMSEQLNGAPFRFGKNISGMQDGGPHDQEVFIANDMFGCTPERSWEEAKERAIKHSQAFAEAGYHKQVYNRLTEPFQVIKAVVSATEWDNFFWLRNDIAADPTIAELARQMFEAMQDSKPQLLKVGEYHLPYIDTSVDAAGKLYYWYYVSPSEKLPLNVEEAIKMSCARCAAVSYRNEGYTLEKCLQLYERLVGAEKKHSSALEHCATPMRPSHFYNGVNLSGSDWEHGVSHADRNGNLWSGNFMGFIQHRKTIAGECYNEESA